MAETETGGRSLPIFTVDAFTDKPFKGNPAAVCLVPREWEPSEAMLQTIAAEMNLSETAFVQHESADGDFAKNDRYRLRWFTPTSEVPLCGHATLSSAAVLFFCSGNSSSAITFSSKSGPLIARRNGDSITLDFPLNPVEQRTVDQHLATIKEVCDPGLIIDVAYSSTTKKLLLRLKDDQTRENLEGLAVDTRALQATNTTGVVKGVIVTLKAGPTSGQPYDFVSRYFAPWVGIPEDPVTGSAHTVLADYWSKQLGKKDLYACQCSRRSGEMTIRIVGDRVELSGKAKVILKGSLQL